MCFSPQMDVAAGVVVGGIGVEALRHVHRPEELPLASLPLLFGAHQLTEAFVWWGLRGDVAARTGHAALWVYVAFAFVALPLLEPVSVLLVEPDARRRRIIGRFALLGAAVAATYLNAMLRGPVSAAIRGHTLTYDTGVAHGGVVAALYMVATVGALLSSSHRRIARFGAANLVVLPLLMLLAAKALTSLWCVWAAVASLIIANHLRLGGSNANAPPGRSRHTPVDALSEWFDRVLGAR
jgi:hypothetical protein